MNCPTPSKIAFTSEKDARSARRRLSHGKRMRIYKCPCGHYHLTSQLVLSEYL